MTSQLHQLLPLVAIIACFLGAYFVAKAGPTSLRRAVVSSASVALLAAIAAALETRLELHSIGNLVGLDGLSAPLFVFQAVMLLAISAGVPRRFLNAQTMSRLLASSGLFLGVLAFREPTLLAATWLLSSVPTLLDLRKRPATRMLLVLQTLSAVVVALGIELSAMHSLENTWAGALVIAGVLVREGTFPFHFWVPRLYAAAPMPTALLFSQAHIGAYLLARLVILGPLASSTDLLNILAAVTALLGASLALGQRSLRRALGYLSAAQGALVLVGLSDLALGTPHADTAGLLGASGAVLVIISVGLAHTGFGLALSAVEARRGKIWLDSWGGGHETTPALAGATLTLGLATIGIPGTLGFIAEDLVFHATLEERPLIGVAMVLATGLAGISILRIAFRVFAGRSRTTGGSDLSLRERAVLGSIGLILFFFGLHPSPLLAPALEAMSQLHTQQTSTR